MKTRALAAFGLTVALAAGSLGAAHAAGVWTDPILLSPDSVDSVRPRVTSSADGRNLVVAWTSLLGLESRVTATHSTDSGLTWAAGATINPPGFAAAGLDLAGSRDGRRQIAVWQDFNISTSDDLIETAAFADGTWADPVVVAAPAGGVDVATPDVTVSADAQRVGVVFRQGPGGNSQVMFSRSTDFGSSYSTPELVGVGAANLNNLQIAGSSDGTRLATIWTETIGGLTVIRETRSADSGATWTNPETISTFGTPAFSPRLFMAADGSRATAVWLRQPSLTERLVVASQSSGGPWSAPEQLSAAGQKAASPALTGAADGSMATAVWVNETNLQVQAARAVGSAWGPPTGVSPAGLAVFTPALATGSTGQRVTAVWMRGGASQQILSNDSLDGGATWGQTVSTSASGLSAGDPAVAASSSGFRAAAAWGRSIANVYRIEVGTYFEQQPQAINFTQPGQLTLGSGPTALDATSSSGLPVSLSSTSSACTVSGNQVTPVAVGDCAITARQPGNADFLPAGDVTRTVRVAEAAPATAPPPTVGPQRIACTGTPPRSIKRRGTTTILPRNCRTDAGQTVTVSVSGKRKDLRKIQVRTKAGKTVVRSFGKRARVKVTYLAEATAGFRALRLTRSYRI